MIAEIILLLLAIAGILICFTIVNKKSQVKMVCHLGTSCEDVLHSKYNKTLGIPNEFAGTIYYFIVGVFAVILLLGTYSLFGFQISSILITLALISVLFSTYLTYIQAFVLHSWCEYCITSAVINVLILLVELFL